MAGKRKLKKASPSGKPKNSVGLLKLGREIAEVVLSLRKSKVRIPTHKPKLRPSGGKVTYRVKVKEPISFPHLEFRYKKDAEAFVRLISKSNTLMDVKVQADILRDEVTEEGFHL